MSILDKLANKRAEFRLHYDAQHDRTLGKALWEKMLRRMEDADALTSDQAIEYGQLHALRHAMGDEAWYIHIGQVANECPDLPRNERLDWLAAELYRRGADC